MTECLPDAFIEKIKRLFPDQASEIFATFQKSKPLSIRVNTLKTTIHEVRQALADLSIRHKEVPEIADAIIISDLTAHELTELALYKEGNIYIQSLSSMIPALLLSPESTDRVLDMAAAPGSKTSQLAALMENRGEIVANDIDRNRMFRLKSVLQTLGVTSVTFTTIPGQAIWQKYPEYFDRVLLDAPCSMEGRFNCQDPATISHWSQKKVKNLSKLQKWLLRSAVSAAKVGGTIVYATCTISPEENEAVIEWIIEKEKENVEVVETRRIFPTDTMEAFYVACLKKIRSNVS